MGNIALPFLLMISNDLLSSEYGTRKTAKARFWPWLSGKVRKTFQVDPSSLASGHHTAVFFQVRRVDVRPHIKGNSNSHGARPVYSNHLDD